MAGHPLRTQAIVMLLITTSAWGLSFPVGKALMAGMEAVLPGRDTWFFSALVIGGRFGLAALLLLLFRPRILAQLTANEWRQGLGLGFWAGIGSVIQTDGLAHTEASTSAFLTQFTAVLVPLAVMLRDRRLPSLFTLVCVGIVMAGVAVLGRFDFATLRLGRGEVETLVAACFFTMLLLWLEMPRFAANNSTRVSFVMFLTIALVLAPIVFTHAHHPADVAVCWATPPVALLFLALTAICSLFAFLMMNFWQPKVDATTAGILYCAEPLFATLFALFLPGLLGPWVGIAYANESMTAHLVIGGGLITVANILIALQPHPPAPAAARAE